MNLILLLHKFTPIFTRFVFAKRINLRFLETFVKIKIPLKSLKSHQIHMFSNIFENREGDTSLFIFVLHNLLIIVCANDLQSSVENENWNAWGRMEKKEISNGFRVLEIHRNSLVLWLNWNEWKELCNYGRCFRYIYVIYTRRNGVEIVRDNTRNFCAS